MSPKKIKLLSDKKHRMETGLFMVEGAKNIRELLGSDFIIEEILGIESFFDSIIPLVNSYEERMDRITMTETRQDVLEKNGTLMTNDAGIAVVRQKTAVPLEEVIDRAKEDIVLALDDIRDPGNLGTIIRIADWFGVTHVAASETTTDFHNPKVIAASMGSFTRVSMLYCNLPNLLRNLPSTPIIAAVTNGISTHESSLPPHGILLLGSESHGLSADTLAAATIKISIPRFGKAESLNVSVASGILLDAMRRS